MSTSVTVTLAELEKPSDINEKVRTFLKDKPAGSEPKITVTGTFRTAKFYDAKESKKRKVDGNYEAKDLKVTKVASEWVYGNEGKREVFLRADSTSDAVFSISVQA